MPADPAIIREVARRAGVTETQAAAALAKSKRLRLAAWFASWCNRGMSSGRRLR